jgi:hypothetical protein
VKLLVMMEVDTICYRALAKQRSKIVAGKIYNRSDENREVFLQFALCFSWVLVLNKFKREAVIKS